MPFLDTTRTSTLTMDYSFSVANRMWQPGFLLPPEAEYTFKNHTLTMSGHLGFSATITINSTAVPNSTDPPYPGGFNPSAPWNWKIYATINCNNGHGVNTSVNVDLYTGTAVSVATNFIDWSSTITGSLSCSVGTDVLWDVNVTSQSEPPPITTVIWPPTTAYRWYERSTTGSTAVTTLTVNSTYSGGGSGSHSATGTVASSRPTAAYNATIASSSSISSPTSTSTTLAVSNVLVNGKNVKTYTHNHTYLSQTATMLSMTLQSIAGSVYSANGTIATTTRLTRYVNLRGNYRAWKSAYPDVLRLNVYGFDYEVFPSYRALTSSSGVVAGSDSFDHFSTTTTLNQSASISPGANNTLTTALNQVPTSIYAETNTTDLVANGEKATESRFLFRGWRFNGMTTSHAATRSITVSGLSNTYTTHLNFSAYRYLVWNITAGGSGTATVVITTQPGFKDKSWDISWAGAGTYQGTIDLCAPNSATATQDIQDTPYPRMNPDPTVNATYLASWSIDGPYWGVTQVSKIVITPSGVVPILNTLTLSTTGYPATTQNFIYPAKEYSVERMTKAVVSESGTTTTFYSRRYWQQDTVDRTEEEADVHWQVTVGGVSGVTTTTIFGRTIANLVDDINKVDALGGIYGGNVIRHDGWTATKSVAQPGGTTCTVAQPPLRDCYLNGDTGLATWVFGGGMLAVPASAPGTGTTYTYGFDVAPGSHTAQSLFDSINGDFIPDIDDPFDISTPTSDSGGPIFEGLVLVGGNSLRGPVHGIAYMTTLAPNVSQPVELNTTSPTTLRGTATTGTYGEFETGLAYARNNTVNIATIGTLNLTTTYYSGKRNRNVFRVASTSVGMSADVHSSLRKFYADVINGTIHLHFCNDHNNGTWLDKDTGIVSDDTFEIRWTITDEEKRMEVLYATSGVTYNVSSNDEGNTFSVPVTIMTGTKPTACVSSSGMQFIFARSSAGAINCVVRDPQGNNTQASHAVVASGVADDSLAAFVKDTTVYLFYRNTSGTVVVVTSTDGGLTFT